MPAPTVAVNRAGKRTGTSAGRPTGGTASLAHRPRARPIGRRQGHGDGRHTAPPYPKGAERPLEPLRPAVGVPGPLTPGQAGALRYGHATRANLSAERAARREGDTFAPREGPPAVRYRPAWTARGRTPGSRSPLQVQALERCGPTPPGHPIVRIANPLGSRSDSRPVTPATMPRQSTRLGAVDGNGWRGHYRPVR